MEPSRFYGSSYSQTGTVESLVDANTRMSAKKAAARKVSRVSKPPVVPPDLRNRAFIGTSGWAYSSWKPGFYPQALPQRKFLEYYATQLNSVEVNYTFRQLPTESMLTGWLAATGAGFRFSFKAPQRITHILRLKNCSDAVAALARPISRPTCLASTHSLRLRIRVGCGWRSNFGTAHGFAMTCTPYCSVIRSRSVWRRAKI
jgi:hypothetical protein